MPGFDRSRLALFQTNPIPCSTNVLGCFLPISSVSHGHRNKRKSVLEITKIYYFYIQSITFLNKKYISSCHVLFDEYLRLSRLAMMTSLLSFMSRLTDDIGKKRPKKCVEQGIVVWEFVCSITTVLCARFASPPRCEWIPHGVRENRQPLSTVSDADGWLVPEWTRGG